MNEIGIKSDFGAFQKSRILLTAYELEIFSIINSGSKSSEEIASECRADPGATDRLLNALCVIGYLTKLKNKFSNTESSLKYLVKGSPEYLSGLNHTVHLWNSWSYLTDCVKRGEPAGVKSVDNKDDSWVEAFIEAMHNRGRSQVEETVKDIDLSGVKTVLDIGGGSGIFSMGFVDKKEGISAKVFDLPNVISYTKKYIEKEGYKEKIDTFEGNYLIDPLPGGNDLIFLSAIVHSNSFENNKKLVKKCYDALTEGGIIVIQDFIMDESRTKPAFGAVFALNMLTGTKNGDTYTQSEIFDWLASAGFSELKRINKNFGADQITGKKE